MKKKNQYPRWPYWVEFCKPERPDESLAFFIYDFSKKETEIFSGVISVGSVEELSKMVIQKTIWYSVAKPSQYKRWKRLGRIPKNWPGGTTFYEKKSKKKK